MERRFAPEASVTVGLDRSSAVPLHRQLYGGLREGILAGTLPAGSRLPSVRVLVRELGVSRNTVEGALAQLSAEGYLETRVGSGTYVSGALPDRALRAKGGRGTDRDRVTPKDSVPGGRGGLSRRGATLAGTPVSASGRRRASAPGPSGPRCRRPTSSPSECGGAWRASSGGVPRGALWATANPPATDPYGWR